MTAPAPCPFCGHTKTSVMELDDKCFCIVCNRCCSCGPTKLGGEQSRAMAVQRWNERQNVEVKHERTN